MGAGREGKGGGGGKVVPFDPLGLISLKITAKKERKVIKYD